MGALGLLIAVNFAQSPTIAILGLSIATMGALTGLPMFWPMPTALLSASAAVAGLAIINSVGQMAGFLSPYRSASSRTRQAPPTLRSIRWPR